MADLPKAPDATLVIFGATGDLTKRLLVPAIVNLCGDGLLGSIRIVGIGSREGDDDMLRDQLDEFAPDEKCWADIRAQVRYLPGDFTQDAVYEMLAHGLADANVAFYLATPAQFFGTVVEKLADHGLLEETQGRFRRILIEKPFGHDLASAQALNRQILAKVPEEQVYRIDHFLGKETVQNILVARFANSFLSAVWERDHIDHVQITAAELVDVGTRGSFYDATGALRDMVPNHLMQLLAMTAMEPPANWGADATRTEKAKVLSAIRTYTADDAMHAGARGQYVAGKNGGKSVQAYADVADVGKDSVTETYVALKLMVDTWRWAGVPFYLRTGKALSARDTEIVIQFKPTPYADFAIKPAKDLPPNRLTLQLQPDEGICLSMEVKRPGPAIETTPVDLSFAYADKFKLAGRTGYETLLYDMLMGDPTLFQRADQIEAGWAAVQPFLDAWAKSKDRPEAYAPGSDGPAGAADLLERDGRQWHALG